MIKAIINLKTVHKNLRKLKKILLPHVKICAVVKANAYSLGDVTVSQEIEPDVDSFAVAAIGEAVRMRNGGIKKPILMLGVCNDYKTAIERDITVSIQSMREYKTLCKALLGHKPTKCKIHIKVNTGMNRYGLASVWQLRSILALAEKNPSIMVEGLYTHLAFETDRTDEIDRQLKKFAPFKQVCRARFPRIIIHAASSGSAGYLPAQFDMVRVGKLMYGGLDGYSTAIKVTSKICAVQNLAPGARVGYGGTGLITSPTVCGIVPCGYADLTHINYGNKCSVLVDGVRCKILGRVCMDSFAVDVTNIHSPLGKTVIIIGTQKGIGIMDISRATDTIACSLLCSLDFTRTEVVYKT
jgi:alanine racemase